MNDNDTFLKLPIFHDMDDHDLELLLPCLGARKKTFKKGEYIILENDEIRYIGIVLSGTVCMTHEDVWGDRSILAVISRGGLFGESFACGSPGLSAVTFQATRDTEVLALPYHKALHLCKNNCAFHATLIHNLMQLLADKNIQLMRRLEITSKKTLRKKILTYLSFCAERAGAKTFQLDCSRSELADFLCADRASLSRELSKMKEEGLIDFDKHVFTVK